MSETPPVVRFENVSLRFGETVALDRVSFSLDAGETLIFFGAAGSGKTMVLKTAVGLVKPDSGRVFLFGQDITDLKESEIFGIRSKVGILFQEGGLFDSLNIEENVGYPLVNQPLALRNGDGGDVSEQEVASRVRESLKFVGLEHTLEKLPSELSGGMRRRAGIARAVVAAPPLVLYDSPTAGLDPITANRIVHLIIKERDLRNTAAILVTHRYQDGHMMANFRYNPNSEEIEMVRPEAPMPVSTRFVVMNEGRIVFEGPESGLLQSADPYVLKFARPGAS